jgi:uncharacterized protein (TIGR03435 family)
MAPMIAGTVLVLFACSAASGQQADKMPSFEVASIKPEPPHPDQGGVHGCFGGPGTRDPSRYRCSRATVGMMAFQAYGIKMYQFPAYSTYATTEYMVDAKVPEGATAEQARLMLRNLLAERFKLAAHFEAEETPIYQLTVAQGGPRIKESAPVDPGAPRAPNVADSQLKKDGDGFPIVAPQPGSMRILRANGMIRLVNGTMPLDSLVNYLNQQLDRPVIDATGLTAKYDFTLTFSSESVKEGSASLMAAAPGEAAEPAGGGRTVFSALERDLGLKLEKAKGMVDIFVIDHVEKTPTPD